ncbi:hypothetical protein MKW92_000191 [Papaver armeniacum]|nr:hypothetical protein MKW92_000191 [Papaver armeniacum]
MFPLSFHYEDVSRQDPLLKLNHANVMEVLDRVKSSRTNTLDLRIQNGKLAMEIRVVKDSYKGNLNIKSLSPIHSRKMEDHISDLSRHGLSLRGQGMSHFSVRISTVMSLLDSPVKRKKRTPFNSPWKRNLEHIRGFNVTIVTSANTQDETLSSWAASFNKMGLGKIRRSEREGSDGKEKGRGRV